MTEIGGGGKQQPVDAPVLPDGWVRPTLAEVYRDDVDFVARIARSLGVPTSQVEDVVHDVFVVVHRRLADFDGRKSVRAWLYGITRRVVMHHQRSFSRAKAREVHAPRPHPSPRVDDVVGRRELVRAVEQCLAVLDDDQRLVFELAEIEGLTCPEIARAHKIKLNTVYSRLRLARKKFESALDRVLDDPEAP